MAQLVNGDPGSVPEWGRSPGEGNGNSFQYSCLGNPMDGGAWWTTVHGVTKRVGRDLESNRQCRSCVCVFPICSVL